MSEESVTAESEARPYTGPIHADKPEVKRGPGRPRRAPLPQSPPLPPEILMREPSEDEVRILVPRRTERTQLVTAMVNVKVGETDYGSFRQQFMAAETLLPAKACEAIPNTGNPPLLRMKPEPEKS